MKNFIKNWLVNFALIVLFINFVSLIVDRDWGSVSHIFELFFVTLLIRLLQIFTSKFVSYYPILEYLLELGVVITVVFSCGWLFGWKMDMWWLILIIITAVYGAAYGLDLARANRDIEYINEQIKRRRIKTANKENGNDKMTK